VIDVDAEAKEHVEEMYGGMATVAGFHVSD
jgi:hypothetical protein